MPALELLLALRAERSCGRGDRYRLFEWLNTFASRLVLSHRNSVRTNAEKASDRCSKEEAYNRKRNNHRHREPRLSLIPQRGNTV
jgi:hypothetical protein